MSVRNRVSALLGMFGFSRVEPVATVGDFVAAAAAAGGGGGGGVVVVVVVVAGLLEWIVRVEAVGLEELVSGVEGFHFLC